MRHGEVFNPQGVLYGRLPGYGLSSLGHEMAQAAADDLHARSRPVGALISSPLQRTQQSRGADRPRLFGLEAALDDRVIEPENRFEGKRMSGRDGALRDVRNWAFLVNPWEPSWGEPFGSIADPHAARHGRRLERDRGRRRRDRQPPAAHLDGAPPRGRQVPRPRPASPSLRALEHHHVRTPGGRLRRGRLPRPRGRARRAGHRRGGRCDRPARAHACAATRSAIAALVAASALLLTGCASDPLADQFREGSGKNYIAGDGTISEFAEPQRGEPIEFSGDTVEGGTFDSADTLGERHRRQLLVRRLRARAAWRRRSSRRCRSSSATTT